MRRNESIEYYYEILGIDKKSSIQEVKSAFRIKIKTYHPDKVGNDFKEQLTANEKSRQLIEAYNALLKEYKENSNSLNIIKRDVVSTNIRSVEYNRQKLTLKITFRKGGSYEYYNIPQTIFDSLLRAESKGRFASAHIYYVYEGKRL